MPVECMNVKPGIEVASLSDVGCQSENNEDSFLIGSRLPTRNSSAREDWQLSPTAWADTKAARRPAASRLRQYAKVYEQSCTRHDPQAALVESFTAAHPRIQDYAEQHPAFHGMGTTCTAFVIRGRQLHFAHVGDSRLYLVRGIRILAPYSRSLLCGTAGGKWHRPCLKTPRNIPSAISLPPPWAREGIRRG